MATEEHTADASPRKGADQDLTQGWCSLAIPANRSAKSSPELFEALLVLPSFCQLLRMSATSTVLGPIAILQSQPVVTTSPQEIEQCGSGALKLAVIKQDEQTAR